MALYYLHDLVSGREDLYSSTDSLNQVHQTIKFMYKISADSISFLDAQISKDFNQNLTTSLSTKPTDMRLYQHRNCFHPTHEKKSISYNQAVAIWRICNLELYYETATQLREISWQNLKGLRCYSLDIKLYNFNVSKRQKTHYLKVDKHLHYCTQHTR